MDTQTNIFLVDDDAFSLHFYEQALTALGYKNVSTCINEEALLKSLSQNPDIIFLDYFLGNSNIIELIHKIQKDHHDTQIVILSSQEDMNITIQLMNIGVFDYIIKGKDDVYKIKDVLGKFFASREYASRINSASANHDNNKIVRIVAEAQDKVRKEISAELHDNINQLLGASKLYVETAINDIENRQDLLTTSKNILETAIEEIRKLSHSLHAVFKKEDSFSESMQLLLTILKTQTKFVVNENIQPSIIEAYLHRDQKQDVLRIFQELINNSMKYSSAKTITAQTNLSGNMLEIIVEDDGDGFDCEADLKSFGVSNVINRVNRLQGKYALQSSPGTGCKWTITIPVMASMMVQTA